MGQTLSSLKYAGTFDTARDSALDDVPSRAQLEAKAKSTLGLVELLLKRPDVVDELNCRPDWQRELFPRLLFIAEASYFAFALVLALLLKLAPTAAFPRGHWLTLPGAAWYDGSALGLILAYTLGIVLAACVCLPSFYFYSLLAGVKMTAMQITSVVAKGTASNAVLLLGILPIYVAAVLGMIVFDAPLVHLHWGLWVGLLLPFVTGLWGLRSIYLGILPRSAKQSETCSPARPCFLRRLTLSWAAIYAAVVPIMIYRLWELFANVLRGT